MKLIEEGFIQRNKKIILISILIFLITVAVSGVFTYLTIGDQYGMITEAFSNGYTDFANEELGLTTDGLFIHNFSVDLMEILGGFLFSIPSLIVLVMNAISIGAMFGADFTFGCLSILPHGLIEYFASALALSAAFLITKLEILMIKNRSFRGTLDENKVILKDILVFIIFTLILLLIAAFIEANITKWVIVSYFGL